MVKVTSREKEEDSSSFSYLGILCTQTKLTVSRRQGEEEELEEGGEHLEKKRKMGLEAHFPYKGLYWREAL